MSKSEKIMLFIVFVLALMGAVALVKSVNTIETSARKVNTTIQAPHVTNDIVETRLTNNLTRYVDKELGTVCYVVDDKPGTGNISISCIPIGDNLVEPFYSNLLKIVDPNSNIGE